MATVTMVKVDNAVLLGTDRIVRRLDMFPELVQAMRDGDLSTGRLLCARLFDCDAPRNHLGEVTPSLRAAMKAV